MTDGKGSRDWEYGDDVSCRSRKWFSICCDEETVCISEVDFNSAQRVNEANFHFRKIEWNQTTILNSLTITTAIYFKFIITPRLIVIGNPNNTGNVFFIF